MVKEVDYFALGFRVKQARESKNLTQDKLAEACGLTTSHIGHVERATRIPSVDTIFKIARSLNVSLDYLLFDSMETNENLFINITEILKTKNKSKVNRFITIIRALLDKIDDL